MRCSFLRSLDEPGAGLHVSLATIPSSLQHPLPPGVIMRRIGLVFVLLAVASCSDEGPPDEADRLIEIVGPAEFSGTPLDTVPELLTVRVTDLNQRPIAGVSVMWSAGSGGSLVPEGELTNRDGIARATWILGWQPGTQQASAIALGTAIPRVFTATAVGFQAVNLSTGDGRHQCATDISDQLSCWGPNDDGQLGNGSVADSDVPVVSTFHPPVGRIVTGSSAQGGDFTCVLASSATVDCWGANEVGQLGNGTTGPSAAPVPVLLPSTSQFLALATRSGGVCAVSRDGEAYCWGQNTQGRLGIGTTADPVLTPTLVTGGFRWRQIALADDRACGVEEGGRIYCWGAQPLWLGTGVDTNTVAPLPVINAPVMDSVTLSGWHQCGLTTSNVTYCWGANHNIGALDPREVIPDPIPLTVPSPFRSLASIYKPTFAIGLDGGGYWWGPPPYATGGGPETPQRFSGDILLINIGTHDDGVCGIEASTSTVYCWNEFSWDGPARLTAVAKP
jgi:hypothetical protein